MLINEYNVKIKHVKGSDNKEANFCSRYLTRKYNRDKYILNNEEKQIALVHMKLSHPGVNVTYHAIKKRFNIKKLKEKIKRIIDNCYICQTKKNLKIKYGKLSGAAVSFEENDYIAMDISGPYLMENFREERISYVVVVVDICTRIIKLYVIKNITDRNMIKILSKYIEEKGVPKKLLTDNGKQFYSGKFNNWCNERKIEHRYTTPYNPTANGVCERINSTIVTGLRMLKGNEFKKSIKVIENSYNNKYHSTLKTSPIQLATQIKSGLLHINKHKKRVLEKISYENRKTNKNRIDYKFKEGNYVFIKCKRKSKLDDLFEGPYKICKVGKDNNTITYIKNKKEHKTNVRRVKPFKGCQDVMRSFLKFYINKFINIFTPLRKHDKERNKKEDVCGEKHHENNE